MTPIQASVGQDGKNWQQDVIRVQCLLNMVPPELGGPSPKLKLDDMIGPKTIGAIRNFQKTQFGWMDGRVDPRGNTESKLHELEGTVDTDPMRLAPDARAQAFQWANNALWALNNFFGPGGQIRPNADPVTAQALLGAFRLMTVPSPPVINSVDIVVRTITPEDAKLLVDKYTKMVALLTTPNAVTYLRTEFIDQYGELKPDTVKKREPATGTMVGVYVCFKFCDWDDVNEWGMGPKTRSGVLLQGVSQGADPSDKGSLTANLMWMLSGMRPVASCLHASEHYSWFAQWVSTRDAHAFYCVPEGPISFRSVKE